MTDLSTLVKPLVWVKDGIGRTVAETIVGTYVITKTGWGRMSDRNETLSPNPVAAAQADYAARILAALDPDAVAKIREDALRLAAIECMRNAAKAKREGRGDYIAHEIDADAVLALIDKKEQK